MVKDSSDGTVANATIGFEQRSALDGTPEYYLRARPSMEQSQPKMSLS
jgi:hypothetical protein